MPDTTNTTTSASKNDPQHVITEGDFEAMIAERGKALATLPDKDRAKILELMGKAYGQAEIDNAQRTHGQQIEPTEQQYDTALAKILGGHEQTTPPAPPANLPKVSQVKGTVHR